MQVTETKNEGLSRAFTVAIPAADFDSKVDSRLKEVAKTANIPGFRPGKVPTALLKKKYGPNVMGEALEQVVNEASGKVLKDRDLRAATQPKIEITKFEEGQDIEYTMDVELMPDIKLGDFSKIKVERQIAEIDESEVQKSLENMAQSYKTSTPIAKKRKAKSGDVAVIDFLGKVDGEEFPGGKAEAYELELGTGSFIPGFEDQIVGAEPGDKLEVKVKFPDEYGAEELAGKDAVFDVTLHELKESSPSEIDDELAKKAGLENLDALKEAIREQHGSVFKDAARQKLKRRLMDALDAEYQFELPQGMVESEVEAITGQMEEAKKNGQLPEEDANKSEDELKAEFGEIAARRVRLGLLFTEIGRENKIEIGQEDINKALMEETKRYPGQEQAVIDHYNKNPDAMQALSGPIFEDKIVDFLLELVKTTDKKVGLEELMADDDAPAAPKKKAAAKSKTKAKAKTKTAKK
ncbi:MAG: trigger factor [Rhodospirillaceae bacterium]|nr:trigger factor [Rhodospirillaceae bacterium]